MSEKERFYDEIYKIQWTANKNANEWDNDQSDRTNELALESFRISFIIISTIFFFAIIIMTTIIYLFFLSIILSIMTAVFTVSFVTTVFTVFFMITVFAVYSVTAIFIISVYFFFFFFFFFFFIILVCNCSSAIKSHWRVKKDEEDIWSILYLKDKQDLTSNNQTKAHRDETHSECSDVIYK